MREIVVIAYHRVGLPPGHARYRGLYVTPTILKGHARILQVLGFKLVTLAAALGSESGKFACITFDDGYLDNWSNGWPALRELDVPATIFVITHDVGKVNVAWPEAGERTPSAMMSWDQLKQLQDSGWEIGSHCHEHVHLSRREPQEQLRLMQVSRSELVARLGAAPQCFAYPYGDFDAQTKSALAAAGFEFAVTTKPGSIGSATQNDPLELPRYCWRGYRMHHLISQPLQLLTR